MTAATQQGVSLGGPSLPWVNPTDHGLPCRVFERFTHGDLICLSSVYPTIEGYKLTNFWDFSGFISFFCITHVKSRSRNTKNPRNCPELPKRRRLRWSSCAKACRQLLGKNRWTGQVFQFLQEFVNHLILLGDSLFRLSNLVVSGWHFGGIDQFFTRRCFSGFVQPVGRRFWRGIVGIWFDPCWDAQQAGAMAEGFWVHGTTFFCRNNFRNMMKKIRWSITDK